MQPTMRGSVDALASDQRIVLDSLAEHFKAHTTGIRESGRLSSAVSALLSATQISADDAVRILTERDLDGVQRPVDVLASRCMTAIRELAPRIADGTESSVDQPAAEQPPEESKRSVLHSSPVIDVEAPAQRRPPIALARSAPHTRSARRPWRRVAATVGAPVVNTPDLQRIVRPITGNRYLGVFAACGGAGSTTLTVLMGSILASCRPDRVVAAEATSTPHALADRAGVEVARSIRDLLADEQRIYGCSELSRFVGRTISRLDVAHLVPGESSLSADEYRRAVAVLARFYDIVLSDVGASGATPAAEPVLGLADLAVVVTSPTQHGWRCAHRLITQLCEGPSAIEPQRIVTVINGVHRRNPVETDRMIVSLRAMCAGASTISWDPHLASGDAVSLAELHPYTLTAASNLVASIVDGLGGGRPAEVAS